MPQNIKCYDCIIIGGGAAGMTAAAAAARGGVRVAIIEHTKRTGTKILQTGNGKCNLTNKNMDVSMYQNEDRSFVKKVLDQFDEQAALAFFQEIGVFSRERNGYLYPHSETAASVNDALRFEIERLGVETVTECHTHTIEPEMHKAGRTGKCTGFLINTDKGGFFTETLILATGSKAAPKTGSDGSGYTLAGLLGHHIKKPLPALVQLTCSQSYCKAMAGVRSTGTLTLYVDNRPLCKESGEIQYTDYGISGIPVFQLSRHAVLAMEQKKEVFAEVDMAHDISRETLYEYIEKGLLTESGKTAEQFFSGILHKKLVYGAGKSCGVDTARSVGELGAGRLKTLADAIKCCRFDITGSKGFDSAQVCQGGVILSEVNPETMESVICPGLYFAGELLDVDGRCGGYNLQWAWSSGYIAGCNAANSQQSKKKGML